MPNEQNQTRRPEDKINWRYQDKTYNDLFKEWRKQHRGGHGFYYADNPNELTYKDGFGFVKNYPEAEEAAALRHVFNIIGMTILIIVGMDIFYLYAMPFILNKLGVDVYLDYFTGTIYGSDKLILGVSVAFEILKRLIPFMYCYKMLNMPLKVMVPMKVANKPLFRASVPAMLLTAGVCSALSVWNAWLFSLLHIKPVSWLYLPEDKAMLAFSLIYNIIIIPVASEIYIRGPVTQLLRQFGDGSAIIFTALLTTMITYDVYHFCYVFVTSVVIGYFFMRTGSVMTGILMRITARAISCGVYMCHFYIKPPRSVLAILLIALICILFGSVYMIHYMLIHKGKLGMPLKARFLSFESKCYIALTSIPVVAGMTVALVFAVLHLRFDI